MEATLPKQKSKRSGVWGWLRSQPPLFLISTAILIVYVLTAITGPWWAPYAYDESLVGPPYSSPSAQHLLGTDNLGRDVFSRVVYGARIDLVLAMSATGLAVAVGTLLGLLTGYDRGWVDGTAMRIVEIIISIPPLILALLVLGSLGSGATLMVLIVAFLYTPRVATVIRAATLDVVMEDYVTIAQLRGESALSIAVRELLPNVLAIVLVEFSLRTGYAVLFIGGLGFLGFGVAPPTPEWGLMINEGRQYLSSAPWSVLGPSFAIAGMVIALSLFTESLSEMLGLTARKGF
jgi:peptide/nickel transport system permease protein